jgi:cell division transport system permease protein
MKLFFQKAIHDIRINRFLNAVTIITIGLSVLIVSAFTLFTVNAGDMMRDWEKGVQVMAYLAPDTQEDDRLEIKEDLLSIPGVANARFISSMEALNQLQVQMKRQASILNGLDKNPLPDAFEIRMATAARNLQQVEALASRIEAVKGVAEVEYGQQWLGRFIDIFNLMRLTGYAIGGIFFMAAVFIVANTIRLMLYSRQTEIEIMRLVGATDGFIKAPFYIEGMIQGACGGIMGVAALFLAYFLVASNIQQDFSSSLLTIRFLPPVVFLSIILCSMFVGWLGCYLSLKQFLKV